MSVMSTTIHQGESTSELYHKFSTSWEIKDLKCLGKNSIKTPSFSPIPNLEFYFEFSYMVSESPLSYKEVASKLVLFWNSCIFNIPKSMQMDFTVTFESATGTIQKKCEEKVSIDEKNSLVIWNVVERLYDIVGDPNSLNHICRMNSNKPNLAKYSPLIMKCNFIFYEHLSTPNDYFRDKQIIRNLKVFVGDFASIYPPSLLGDVKFKIEDELLPAHKSILAAHSPVLLRMLSSDFLESKTNIIPIADSTPEMFNFFLKFLYCGEMEDKSWPVVKELYLLADKYDVRALKRYCGDLLASFLSIENVCEILRLAYNFKDDDLKPEAKSFAAKYFDEIASKEDWKELAQSSPSIAYEVVMNFISKPI